MNHKLVDKAETIYINTNENNEIVKQKFYKELSSLENKTLKEILEFYKNINKNNNIGYDDIYFYLYHKKINNDNIKFLR